MFGKSVKLHLCKSSYDREDRWRKKQWDLNPRPLANEARTPPLCHERWTNLLRIQLSQSIPLSMRILSCLFGSLSRQQCKQCRQFPTALISIHWTMATDGMLKVRDRFYQENVALKNHLGPKLKLCLRWLPPIGIPRTTKQILKECNEYNIGYTRKWILICNLHVLIHQ